MPSPDQNQAAILQRRIRLWVALFVIGLILSGVTAFPLVAEVKLLVQIMHWPHLESTFAAIGLTAWIERVRDGLVATDAAYPFLAYGTDWLAFAHIVIALAFIGVWRDAVRNVWIVEWAMLCCVLVWPLAFICGPIRGIPLGWRIIDCLFGVFGLIPLFIVRREIYRLEKLQKS